MHNHHRRKSGHGSANTSMTDVRKAVSTSESSRHSKSRPAALTRKSTPQKLGKSPKEREKDFRKQDFDDDEFDTFPQYWYVFFYKFVYLCTSMGNPSSPSQIVGRIPRRYCF
jgi:hypothetical protein